MTKVTYSPSENIYEADEAYWQGEEFRKETPCFPKSVYKYLPDLLNECILEEEGDREQDLSFLSNLTALSSVLPGTFGIYNHKKYSPHFYSFGIAPRREQQEHCANRTLSAGRSPRLDTFQ